MDPLFPKEPEDLAALSDEELAKAEDEFRAAVQLIVEDDKDFLGDRTAEDIIAQMEAGVESIEKIVAERDGRAVAAENFEEKKAELAAKVTPKAEPVEVVEEETLEVKAEEEPAPDDPSEPPSDEEEEVVAEKAEEKELVLASAETAPPVRLRRSPPAPSPERTPVVEEPVGTALVAAGEMSNQFRDPLDPKTLADLVIAAAQHYGPAVHDGQRYGPRGMFDGPPHKIARAEYPFPEERTLTQDVSSNLEKIESVGSPFFGKAGRDSLVASGGLCAPATPFYSMPNFATDAEPVWDSLPVFRANRGAVNTPEATIIGDILVNTAGGAITSISEENDALGGTFATKTCQDLDCPPYTEVAVNIIAHCRTYGNLNAISWPEKIAHENALTMAALAATSEMFILERIKALSVNVTSGANTLSALTYLVDAIAKSQFGIRGRLRMPADSRFRVLLPVVILDMLLVDAVQNGFDRYKTRGELDAYLRTTGVDPVYYLDGNFTTGDDMVPDADQGAGALESWPNTFQWALYPEGAFLGIDMGVLELGIVRDSILNETNDFQVFGERFRNVTRIAPAQAAYWETTTLCAVGQFPPAGTARTCES